MRYNRYLEGCTMNYLKRFVVGLISLPVFALLAVFVAACFILAIPVALIGMPIVFVHDLGKDLIG
jgi:hypothetical protein